MACDKAVILMFNLSRTSISHASSAPALHLPHALSYYQLENPILPQYYLYFSTVETCREEPVCIGTLRL